MTHTRGAGRSGWLRAITCVLAPTSLAALLLAACVPPPASAADEQTVNAFAVWVGRGGTFQTGPKDLTFVGSLIGRIYAETIEGPTAWGRIVCPALVKVAEDGTQKGTGYCTLIANDGAQIYAELNCAGQFMVGCQGELKITAGTERFARVSGAGPVLVRSDQRTITVQSEVTSTDESTGILYLRGFKYRLP